MDLFDETEFSPKKKKKERKKIKTTTILMILIIILVILCMAIFAAIVYLKKTTFEVYIDWEENDELLNMLVLDGENTKIPIKQIAKYFGYEFCTGNYETSEEDEKECYVKNDYEVTMITADSNKIYQISLEEENNTKEKIELNSIITLENEEFYTNIEGAEKIFNIIIKYPQNSYKINIYTAPGLYTYYAEKYSKKGYTFPENETYFNQKLVLDNLLIAQNSSNNLYGVIKIQENELEFLLETKYDSIEYLRNYSTFLVTKNNKKGIIDINKNTILEIEYDSITAIQENDSKYYMVEKDGLIGLNDENGKIIIYPEYDSIGLDKNEFSKNGVTNNYILYDKYIPVCSNKKWALFDIQGNNITGFKYDSFGSISKTKGLYSVLLVSNYKLIVVEIGDKYNFLYDYESSESPELFTTNEIEAIYMKIQNGEKKYYFTIGEQEVELETFLTENNVNKVQ